MKKLMIAAAAMAVGVAMADVESANVVGYASKNLTKNAFRLASVPFDGVGEAASLNINDTVKYPTTVQWDGGDPSQGIPPEFWTTAPQIQIQNPNGSYNIYYRITDAWYGDEDYDEGWADDNGTATTKAMFESGDTTIDGNNVPGQAIWFKDPLAEEDVAFQTAGEVPSADVDISVPAAFRLRAATFPVAFQVNNKEQAVYSNMPEVYWDGGDPSQGIPPEYWTTAPQLQIQLPNGAYQILYYLADAWYGPGDDDLDAGWADDNGTAVTPQNFSEGTVMIDGVCPVNGGFWAKGVSAGFNMKLKAPKLK